MAKGERGHDGSLEFNRHLDVCSIFGRPMDNGTCSVICLWYCAALARLVGNNDREDALFFDAIRLHAAFLSCFLNPKKTGVSHYPELTEIALVLYNDVNARRLACESVYPMRETDSPWRADS